MDHCSTAAVKNIPRPSPGSPAAQGKGSSICLDCPELLQAIEQDLDGKGGDKDRKHPLQQSYDRVRYQASHPSHQHQHNHIEYPKAADHGMRQIGEVLLGFRKVRLAFLSILMPNLTSSNAGHRGVGISIERA
jgi:hypothetical protein